MLAPAAGWAGVLCGAGEGLRGLAEQVLRAVRDRAESSGDLGRRRVSNAPY